MGHAVNCIRISTEDANYYDAVGRLARSFLRAEVVPFLGAGVSCAPPSCLPAAIPFIKSLRRALWQSTWQFVASSSLSPQTFRTANAVVKNATLERLLSVLEETHGRKLTIDQFLEPLQGSVWNWNHSCLAALAVTGHIPHFISMNFDLLLEEAIEHANGNVEVVCPLGTEPRNGTLAASFLYTEGNVCTRIIKPHGSFAPADSGFESSELVATTLPDVGDRPAQRNRNALESVLEKGTELFVAGYSDDDWDIFPIIEELAGRLAHIHWVHFATDRQLRSGKYPWDVNLRDSRVRSWLLSQDIPVTSYVGDPAVFLRAVVAELGLAAERPTKHIRPAQKPDGSIFVGTDHNDILTVRTCASMAILLQDRGAFNDALLKILVADPIVKSQPLLEARLHRVLAHTHHTRREIFAGSREMKKVLKLKQLHHRRTNASTQIAEDLVWLGYEYLCLVKRPSLYLPLFPFFYLRGHALLWKGVCIARRENRFLCKQIIHVVRFYRVDFWHGWAEQALLLGKRFQTLIERAFAPLAKRYEEVMTKSPELMEWDYYWLRALESRLLAGDLPGRASEWEEMERKLEKIAHRYEILQNHVQSGNVSVYKALLRYCKTGEVRAELLDSAEKTWREEGGVTRSGLFRVLLYRRYFELIGVFEFLKRLSLKA